MPAHITRSRAIPYGRVSFAAAVDPKVAAEWLYPRSMRYASLLDAVSDLLHLAESLLLVSV
jgi:hypothetical protein